ncbi:hypothetical protein ACHAXS_001796 [Conticribra weissflogii]
MSHTFRQNTPCPKSELIPLRLSCQRIDNNNPNTAAENPTFPSTNPRIKLRDIISDGFSLGFASGGSSSAQRQGAIWLLSPEPSGRP